MLERAALREAPQRASEPLRDAALLERILAYDPDKPGIAMPFSKRLAQENGWTHAYALAVISEYKRFVYLACISKHEVVPSDEVDQVWHLHLAHSRDYWLDFCDKVLQRQLHHDPAEGGTSDEAQFTFNYKRTLTLYQTIFGKAPPPAVWPPAPIRFAYRADRRKVNFALFSIAPKKSLVADRAAYIIAPFIVGVMAVMLSGVTIPFIPQWDAGSVLWVCAGTFGIAYALWRLMGGIVVNVLKSKSSTFRDRNSVNRTEHGYHVTYMAHAGATIGGYAWLPDVTFSVEGGGGRVSEGGGGSVGCGGGDGGSDGGGC